MIPPRHVFLAILPVANHDLAFYSNSGAAKRCHLNSRYFDPIIRLIAQRKSAADVISLTITAPSFAAVVTPHNNKQILLAPPQTLQRASNQQEQEEEVILRVCVGDGEGGRLIQGKPSSV